MPFSFFLLPLTLILVSAKGQTISWTEGTTANLWYTATNWTPNTTSGSWLISNVGQFDNTGTATTAGIDMGTSSLSIGGVEISAARTRVLGIGNSSAINGTLTLNGSTINSVNNVILRNASNSSLFIQDGVNAGSALLTLALANNTDNVVNIDGTGDVNILSSISGVGKKLTLGGIGAGILSLSAANSYTGLTTVSSNTLQLNGPAGGTLPAGNDILINGIGTLKISSNQTLNNLTLATGGTLTVDNGVTLTINGTFNQNGGTIVIGTGSIIYGTSATLSYGGSSLQTTNSNEFPLVSGPATLTINNSAGVVLHATRTISTLNFIDGNFTIGANDFTVSAISGLPANLTNRHVVTNLTGELIITNIGVGLVLFPIGANATTLNPIWRSNGQNINYGARVEIGINPAISYPLIAVNRTWNIKPSVTPSTPVNVLFFYSAGDGNATFNYTTNVELGLWATTWNVIQTGLVPSGSYQVASTVSILGANQDAPLVIGNLGAILSAQNNIDLVVQKQDNKAHLMWTTVIGNAEKIEIERSSDGRNFNSLSTVGITVKFFDDKKLLSGINYYRIKITDINGAISYSSIATMLNKESGFEIVNLVPTLVTGNAVLNVTAAQKTKMDIVITDISGRQVQKIAYNLIAGSNQFTVNLSNLSAGTYQMKGYTMDGVSRTIRFVKQ